MVNLELFAHQLTKYMSEHSRYIGKVGMAFDHWDPQQGLEKVEEHTIVIRPTKENQPQRIDFSLRTIGEVESLFHKIGYLDQWFAVRVWPEYAKIQYKFEDIEKPENNFVFNGEAQVYFRLYVAKKGK